MSKKRGEQGRKEGNEESGMREDKIREDREDNFRQKNRELSECTTLLLAPQIPTYFLDLLALASH